MSTAERITVLQRWYRLFDERDLDALIALMTDEWSDVAYDPAPHAEHSMT